MATTIRYSATLHSKSNLSIGGKATVLNTLIYSKLWHVMRAFIFIKSRVINIVPWLKKK